MVKIVCLYDFYHNKFFTFLKNNLKEKQKRKVKMIQTALGKSPTIPDYGHFTMLLIRIFLCASKNALFEGMHKISLPQKICIHHGQIIYFIF